MLLRDLVETSGTVAATRSRKAKVAALAERLAHAEPDELPVVTAYLGGTILQRRTGVGWRGLSSLPDPAAEPSVTALEVHEALDRLAAMAGAGSQELRASGVRDLFARMTADEQRWLRGVMTGNVRQGALDALVQEAIAAASGVKLTAVRRAALTRGIVAGRVYLPLEAAVDAAVAAHFEQVIPGTYQVLMGRPLAAEYSMDAIEAAFSAPGAIAWPVDDF